MSDLFRTMRRFSKLRSNSKSERSKLIKKIDKLIFEHLKIIRGKRCELCGKEGNVTPFHILPKGAHPRLRFKPDNILLACWMPCHYSWHHDVYKALEIIEKIKVLRGSDYKEKLLIQERCAPKQDLMRLRALADELEKSAKYESEEWE